ncbi:MAG: YfhO family protein [Erysipelotrichaceae bacterium]|nr:YfhO family protein [Erysipelotrichaceae bacterium]
MIFLIFIIFFLNNRSFVWYLDGWKQHYKALVYYGNWLRTIINNIFINHTFEIPTYSFSIGYGSDIITTLQYYVIGDPLTIFAVFVPSKYMAYFYSFLVLVRFYLSGISFSIFCLYINDKQISQSKKNSMSSILVGTFVYVFSGYALYAGIRHPYFTNPMIYFPLILLGVEKILNNEKPYVFILSVFISAISNFYFFYMIVILTILYVVFRLITLYFVKSIKECLILIGKITAYSVLGTCMSAVLLLPSIISFFNSSRLESGYIYDLFYSIADYESNIGGFLSISVTTHDWTAMGYGAIALIAIIILFIQKHHTNIKVAFVLTSLMILIPTVGHIMNGFSYVSNRWIWGYSFLIAYIIVIKWDNLFSLSRKEKTILLFSLVIYTILCMSFYESQTLDVLFALIICFVIWLLICVSKYFHYSKILHTVIMMCILINILGNSYFFYSTHYTGYAEEFLTYDEIEEKMLYSEEIILDSLSEDNQFYRYSTNSSKNINGTLYSGLHSVQYYWSLENGNISEFRDDLSLSLEKGTYSYKNLDSRTILSTLANIKYYVQKTKIPYGYTLIQSLDDYSSILDYLESNSSLDVTEDNNEINEEVIAELLSTYDVYENDYFLPFGYTYSTYISETDYDNMTPLEKQESMLQGCVIDESKTKGNKTELIFTGEKIKYEVELSDDIIISNNKIIVTSNDSDIVLHFDGLDNSETYLYITGLSFSGISPKDRYSESEWYLLSDSEKNSIVKDEKYYVAPSTLILDLECYNVNGKRTTNTLKFYTEKDILYNNRKDFMINFGYDDSLKESITITFPYIGEYSYDSIEVLCQPLENYETQILRLSEDTMYDVCFYDDNEAFATNSVTGNISLDSSKYLLLTIPYEDGWTAYVDDEEVEILRANTMYMALYLEPGDHQIVLKYMTPGLKIGAFISGLTLLLLIGIFYFDRKRL